MRTTVWTFRYGQLNADPCNDEEEAYYFARTGEDGGAHCVIGFSYEDGRAVKTRDDREYAKFCDQRDAIEKAQWAKASERKVEVIKIPVPPELGVRQRAVHENKLCFEPEDLAYLLPKE